MSKKESTANRGMKFEHQIEEQCELYKQEGIAYIDKLPTDWMIKRVGGKIVSGYPRAKSKLDFYGVLSNGMAIFIEAKSTKSSSLPLSNFKDHQFVYIEEISKYTPYVYVLIQMRKYDDRVFLVEGLKILEFKNNESRKSLPLDWLESNGIEIFNMDFLNEKWNK